MILIPLYAARCCRFGLKSLEKRYSKVSFILVVRAFAHAVMGRPIDPSWGGPIELFLVPASAPRLV